MSAILSILALLFCSLAILYITILRREKQALIKHQDLISENTKATIGRDLHDNVGALLLSVTQQLKKLHASIAVTESKIEVQKIIDALDKSTQEIRTIAHNLIPDTVHIHGLWKAIEMYCNSISKNGKPTINLHLPAYLELNNPKLCINIYRIIQELIQNTIKHADAEILFITIKHQENNLYILTENDGVKNNQNPKPGIGLHNIKTRIAAYNGQIKFNTDSESRWLVYIKLKIKNN